MKRFVAPSVFPFYSILITLSQCCSTTVRREGFTGSVFVDAFTPPYPQYHGSRHLGHPTHCDTLSSYNLPTSVQICDVYRSSSSPFHTELSSSRLAKSTTITTTALAMMNTKWDREIEENSRKRASGGGGKGGIGETAAGAVLGGLLLGPFGALFGASIGSNIGAKNAMDRTRKEEMERLGISEDMLETAREIGLLLERSNEGLKATQDSLETQQRFARRLDANANELYDRAKDAINRSDEETARKLLFDRTQVLDKLKSVLKQCAEEKRRIEQMENNVQALEMRAMEIDTLLRRTVSAKTVVDTSESSRLMAGNDDIDLGLSIQKEDPLLQKFRDLGID